MSERPRDLLLSESDCWQVRGRPDSVRFFREVGSLLPGATMLFLEVGSPPLSVENVLKPLIQKSSIEPPRGTSWPRAQMFQVPFNPDTLQLLAELAESHAEPEYCDHMQVYQDTEHVLEWYDAFDDTLWVTGTVPEEQIRQFAERLELHYSAHKAAV